MIKNLVEKKHSRKRNGNYTKDPKWISRDENYISWNEFLLDCNNNILKIAEENEGKERARESFQ